MKGRIWFQDWLGKTYKAQKRFLAFLLTLTIILTNIGADMNTAFAAVVSDSVTFSMSGSQLLNAIEDAITSGSEVTRETLDFTNDKAAEFEKLFFGEGRLYEAFPDAEGESPEAQLRVFVRLPEECDDTYQITGEEEIILLYVNSGNQTISFTTEITRTEDGVNKVKKTKYVTVKNYEAAFGDEERNAIPDSQEKSEPENLYAHMNREGTVADAATEADAATAANAAKADDLAGIGYCSTAKAYITTVNQLKALDDIEGRKITYTVNPKAGARIIEGPRGVEDGQELSFGVKNQIGYEIETVTANDELLQADSVTDHGDGSQTVWYVVPEIYGEQDVRIHMAETGAHPAVELPPMVMADGMVITVSAGPGVLPAGVTATALRVSTRLEDAVKQTVRDAAGGKEAAFVTAYDINLWLGDQLLDSGIWGGDQLVHVNFSGTPIEEQSDRADTLEVMYVETVQDKDREAKAKAARNELEVKPEDIVKLEPVGKAIPVDGETPVNEVSFEAEHFSIYAVVGSWVQNKLTMQPGKTAALHTDAVSGKYEWSVDSKGDTVSIIDGQGTSQVTVKAGPLKEKTVKSATVTCQYGSKERETFMITVDSNNAYAGYFYIRKPGTEHNEKIDFRDAWYYAGKVDSAIVGLKKPSMQNKKYNDWQFHVANFPDQYPKIEANGRKYAYSDMKQPGTYSIDWQYIKEAPGANDGHGTVVGANIPTYHVDGYATLYDTEYFTVNFKIKEPGSPNISTVFAYTVEQGKPVKKLPRPKVVAGTPKDGEIQNPMMLEGVPYELAGWYTDETYTTKVDFQNDNGAVNSNLNYYGRYLEKFDGTLVYDLNAEDAAWLPAPGELEMKGQQYYCCNHYNRHSKVTVPLEIPSRPGYDFVHWSFDPQGEGKESAAAGTAFDYPNNDGQLTMYAIWKPKEVLTVTVTGTQVVKEYSGKEQQVTGFTSDAPADVTVALVRGKKAEAKGTTSGTYPMGLDAEDFTAVSPNYGSIKIIVEDGFLSVTPSMEKLTVTITGTQATLMYNGEKQRVSGFTSDAPDSVQVSLRDGCEAAAEGSAVNTYYMGLDPDDFVVNSPNYANIEVVVVDGTLTITPDPSAGGGSESVDPPAGGGSESVDPPAGGGSESVDPQTGGGSESVDPPTGGGSESVDPPAGGGSAGGNLSRGGGSSHGGPHMGGSPANGGPGAAAVFSEDMPLAALPNDNSSIDRMIIINDDEVPLGNLPKTGKTSANGWVLFLSSIMLAAYAIVTKKKHEES